MDDSPARVLLVGITARRLGISSSASVEIVTATTADDATELLRHEDYAVLVVGMARLGNEAAPLLHWAKHLVPQPSAIGVLGSGGVMPTDLLHDDSIFAVTTEPVDQESFARTLTAAIKVAKMNDAVSHLSRATTRLFSTSG